MSTPQLSLPPVSGWSLAGLCMFGALLTGELPWMSASSSGQAGLERPHTSGLSFWGMVPTQALVSVVGRTPKGGNGVGWTQQQDRPGGCWLHSGSPQRCSLCQSHFLLAPTKILGSCPGDYVKKGQKGTTSCLWAGPTFLSPEP